MPSSCPRCGLSTPIDAVRCASCGAEFSHLSPAAAATTGLGSASTIEVAPLEQTTTGSTSLATAAGAIEPASALAKPRHGGPLQVGQALGARYRILKLLGTGGMGAVYEAWDRELAVAVALKVIRPDVHRSVWAELEKRFKNELLLARQVTHKHVVRIHDLGEIDGIKYITMPYIEGYDLATLLRREGKLPLARALHFARQIASGLEAAHEAGVVHRDLKPANIMIGGTVDDPHAVIMDFGISATVSDPTRGIVTGTFEYMAPEQGAGLTVDARADIYSFGLILYEMLTGPRLVGATTPQERLEKMLRRFDEGLPPPRSIDPAIPEPVAGVVARCLDRDPDRRFRSASELAAALARLDDHGEWIPEPRRLTPRLVVAATLLVGVMAAGTYVLGRRAAPAPRPVRDPVPILIADFENRAGDSAFDGALEQTLATALESASYITVFKTANARTIAAGLRPDGNRRITDELGQLIARREGIKVLLGGAIEKQAPGYRLEVRASDPATGRRLTTVSRVIRDRAQALSTVALMARDVREALGESKTEMEQVAAAETVTAGSLDAVRAYVRAQELQQGNKWPEALEQYQRAVELDPQFARAYAGIAGVYGNYFKDSEKAEAAYQAAMKHFDRMTEREKYRTLGTYYLDVARNFEKAIENYETLVKLYPADDSGHGNLALAYTRAGNLQAAAREVGKNLQIYPGNFLQRYNHAMYSMYAGDFDTAVAEASRVERESPRFEWALLPQALSRLVQGDVAAGRDAYTRMAAISEFGASFATLGRADLEMYFGHYRQAADLLNQGIALDLKRKASTDLARKYVALADAYLALGNRRRASEAASQAVKLSRSESILVPAARVWLQAGEEAKALGIAADLQRTLQTHASAYARLINGEAAHRRGRTGEAIEVFLDAQKRHDSWWSRFLLGRTYVEAGGHFTEGLRELELCVKRRGEAADVFVDDLPTLRYLPPAYYWLGRAQEGAGVAGAGRANYELFVKLRSGADPPDPLVADAMRRLQTSRQARHSSESLLTLPYAHQRTIGAVEATRAGSSAAAAVVAPSEPPLAEPDESTTVWSLGDSSSFQ
jgi:tetratricopeptide (TPR) repeat protein